MPRGFFNCQNWPIVLVYVFFFNSKSATILLCDVLHGYWTTMTMAKIPLLLWPWEVLMAMVCNKIWVYMKIVPTLLNVCLVVYVDKFTFDIFLSWVQSVFIRLTWRVCIKQFIKPTNCWLAGWHFIFIRPHEHSAYHTQ